MTFQVQIPEHQQNQHQHQQGRQVHYPDVHVEWQGPSTSTPSGPPASTSAGPSASFSQPRPVSPKKRKGKEASGDCEEAIINMQRLEHERRMDNMLKEHQEKMEIYALKKEILRGQLKKQIEDDDFSEPI